MFYLFFYLSPFTQFERSYLYLYIIYLVAVCGRERWEVRGEGSGVRGQGSGVKSGSVRGGLETGSFSQYGTRQNVARGIEDW